MALTFSPDAPHLLAGAGTAASQLARPRQYANLQAGGWQTTVPVWATGATAGTPGGWTPAPSYVPLDLADVRDRGVVASPATAWTVGQYARTYDNAHVYWDGNSWEAGNAP